ncbi:hypothetical protein ABG768_023517 [Culter alburnus]|uniref:Uncharacterized protein n=1 Tax=Culter alburnus TaxID=194366 RepID=A0AAW2AH84_CULAL
MKLQRKQTGEDLVKPTSAGEHLRSVRERVGPHRVCAVQASSKSCNQTAG